MPAAAAWRDYRGRSRLACAGRCVTARNLAVFYLTLGLILLCSALFFAFDCRFLAINLSPAVPIAGALQFAFVICCLLRTTCSDPGIVPRGSPEEAAWIEEELEPPKPEPHGAYRPQPRLKDVVIGGRVFKLKYCFTCKLWRPPRASHCSSCDNCVDRFDHHCPWVGNCVGRRNYRYFFMFLAGLSVYCLYIMIFSIVNVVMLAKERDNLLDALKKSPPSVLVILVAFFSIWSVAGLAGFHVLLICREVSTNEDIKGVFNRKRNPDLVNPFDRGDGCSNCCYVLFGPVQPSLLSLRPWRGDGDADADHDDDSSSVEGLLSNGGGGGGGGCGDGNVSAPIKESRAGGGGNGGGGGYGSVECVAPTQQTDGVPIGRVPVLQVASDSLASRTDGQSTEPEPV